MMKVRKTLDTTVARQAFVASFEEFLGPAIVQALGNAFATADRSDAILAL